MDSNARAITEQEAGVLVERAPAKVNLTLRVLGRRADGYHDLMSIVAFAGTADRLTLQPGPELSLAVAGADAAEAGPAADNLVLKAARALIARVPGLTAGHFRLEKRLPVAAGLGGGSSDAAAALRLLARLNGLPLDDPRLIEAAAAVGSDVPVCLGARASLMRGRGESVEPLVLPRFGAVLVNPRIGVSTAEVFRLLALAPGEALAGPAHPDAAHVATGLTDLTSQLIGLTNDLEAPARRLVPVLAEVEAALGATPAVRLVRMSGSGATMFALYDDCRAAGRAAKLLRTRHSGWWVRSTVLR